MKWITLFYFLTFSAGSDFTESNFFEKTQLAPCPSSPNCVSSQETRKRKKMKPFSFSDDMKSAMEKFGRTLAVHPRAKLVKKEGNYFHYEFKTKIGKFIDDVEFIFDKKTKQIHFRSASRKGWGDFGKNKRRMKKLRKRWDNSKIKSQKNSKK